MANPLHSTTHIGTLGELIVQLRLLEYGIQAAPPIKDSGNDLVAIKGGVVKFVQVKTSQGRISSPVDLPRIYDIVALVELSYGADDLILFDQSKIYVFKEGQNIADKQELTRAVADSIWAE